MRFLECCRDLLRNRECFVERNRAERNAVSEYLARHEFQDQEVSSVDFFDAVDTRDIGMIQGLPARALHTEIARRVRRLC